MTDITKGRDASQNGWEIEVRSDLPATSWLEAIIESADDAIISKTLTGHITSWNKGAELMFGYTADEAIGQSVMILFPEDHVDEEEEILSRIGRGERIRHYETIRKCKDGRLIDVSLTVSPVRGPDGEVIGASKIARNITERRLAEARIREQAEVLETTNRIGRMVSAELDLQKLVQAVTDAATELTAAEFGAFFYNLEAPDGGSYMLYSLSGVEKEKFADFPMPRATSLFGPTFRGEGTVRMDDVRKDERFGRNTPYNGLPAGHLPVTSYLAVPVRSRSGDVIGGLFFGHSAAAVFTEQHERIIEGLAAQAAVAMDNARLYERAQAAIREKEALLASEQQSRELAETASRMKDEFLGLLSHELRTPLNSIVGWTRILQTTEIEETTLHTAIDAIRRSADAQSRLIEDMLDVSRIISGKMRLDAQPVDLTTVINAAVDTLRPAAEAKNIRLYVSLDFGDEAVLGDPVRLQQIIWNLVSNAIKFTPKGGTVNITLERINSHFEISVCDTGPGISDDFLPYVFDRFRQGDSSATKKYSGLGLGLAIVQQLVELHGGSVEAANRKDSSGAMFVVNIPVMAVRRPAALPDSAEKRSRPGKAFEFDCPTEIQGLKVLAVDDDADSRMLLETFLTECGAIVRTSASVREALAALEEFAPDVLVSDIGMPDEDGYSLIRKVRAAEANTGRRIPAVALTAYARVEDRLKALSAGFNMHVPKPVEPLELAVVIASLFGRSSPA